MRSAFALRINSGKNIFIVVTLENLRIFQSYFFTGGGAKVMQLPLPVTAFPVKRGFRNARRRF